MYAAIPDTVQRFLRRHIASLWDLEVFLLLARNPEQWWTSEAVAEELRGSTLSARQALRRLVSEYLLAFRGTGPGAVFKMGPSDPSVDALVPLLAQLFRYRLTALAEFIYGPEHAFESSKDALERTYQRHAASAAARNDSAE